MTSVTDDQGYNQGFVLHPSTVIRMQRRAQWLLSPLKLTKDSRILEVGCGTGEVAYWMAKKTAAQVIGIDTCASFIEYANQKYQLPNLTYRLSSVQELDQARYSNLDAIVGNGILHHLEPELQTCLQDFYTLLKPGGQLTFMEPNYYNPYIFTIFTFKPLRRLAKLEPNEMAFSKPYITSILVNGGYTNTKVMFRDFLIPGVPSFLVPTFIAVGKILEQTPLLSRWSQSLFIYAEKPNTPQV